MNTPELGTPLPAWEPATLPPHETINGRYCQLQPLQSTHAGWLWDVMEDAPALWTYLDVGPFESGGDFLRWIEAQVKREDAIFWAICDGEGKALGLCAFLRLDPDHGSIEIGNILFSPPLQRTSAATEAMFLLMRAAFGCGFRRYEWKCNSLNKPSKAAAKRLGFRFEGTFRQAAVVKGHNRDTDWYSITDGEWTGQEKAFERWLSPANFDKSGRQIRRMEGLRSR